MGIHNDIKKEWTKEGIKSSLKEGWPDFLAIAIASGLTPDIIQWLGWTRTPWTYIVVFLIIAIMVGIVVGFVLGIIKRIKK